MLFPIAITRLGLPFEKKKLGAALVPQLSPEEGARVLSPSEDGPLEIETFPGFRFGILNGSGVRRRGGGAGLFEYPVFSFKILLTNWSSIRAYFSTKYRHHGLYRTCR